VGKTVGPWAELVLRGVAVATLGEAAGRRVVEAHAEAYRAGDP